MDLPRMSLTGGLLILAVLLLRAAAFDRLPKRVFPALWGVALARLLLPVTIPLPSGPAPLPWMRLPAPKGAQTGLPGLPGGGAALPPAGGETVLPQGVPGAAGLPVLPLLWGLGAAALGAYFLVSWLRYRREFRTALPVQAPLVDQWLSAHPLRRTVRVRQLTGLFTPLTYGVLRPVILLPRDMDWADRRQTEYMLYHESVHIRRFDTLWKGVAAAALCLHWFNPLVWALYILFDQDLELACDEEVLRRFGPAERKDYALMLLRVEEAWRSPTPFGSFFGKNKTEERICAIMKYRKKSIAALAIAGALLVGGAAAAFLSSPGAPKAGMEAVLSGEAEFLYVSDGAAAAKTIGDVPALFSPDDSSMKIWAYASLDLDGDGGDEIVLAVTGGAGDLGGQLILHQMDGRVYAYKTDSRTLTDLKTDATGSYSDPTGAKEGGICTISAFSGTGYTLDKISYGSGTYEGWDTFVVDHRPAAEEELQAALERQAEKPDVSWVPFDAGNLQ